MAYSQPWFQYPTKTEPVLAGAEQVTESRWHQPWSEPVRFKISGQLAIALAASGLFFPVQTAGELIFVDKWINQWREPLRFKGIFRGMPTGAQQAIAPSPQPFVSFGWFAKLDEPIVKKKIGLREGSQRFHTGSPLPFVSFGWFRPQTELPPLPKVGLSARLQMFLARPPRVLPTPTISGSMSAIEQGDTALFGMFHFGTPVEARVGVIELAYAPFVSLIETRPSQGVSGLIEEHVAPASGSPTTAITSAAVSIRIV